jgi:hypothetical protein
MLRTVSHRASRGRLTTWNSWKALMPSRDEDDEVPVPAREDFLRDLRKVAPPAQPDADEKAPER